MQSRGHPPSATMRAPSLIALIMCALVANAVAVHFLDVWSLVDEDEIMEVVRHVSVERIVDTEPHKEVEQYIADMFSRHAPDWTFERDSFVDDTPDGKKTFVNLIATLDAVSGQTSDKYIVLAAHYDSKVINGIKFEAAVDSAVPCAILIQFARNFKAMTSSDLLTGYKGHNWGIKIIFFDGEEAFHEWTPVDSIYGSRHLAQDWAEGSQKLLEKIDAFFLFDLLGGPNMAPIPSRYTSTNNKFNYFVAAQTASQQAGRLPIKLRYFSSTPQPHVTIEDDHIPWLRRGVPIVHLIPAPFPEVWHKETDTWQNVDTTSVRHLTGIIHLAILNYLEDN